MRGLGSIGYVTEGDTAWNINSNGGSFPEEQSEMSLIRIPSPYADVAFI